MPSIEIDCALTNSQVPASGFTAAGTWENGGTAPQVTCTLTPSGGGNVSIPVTAASDGTWSGASPALTAGATYSLTASFPNAAPDTETNIQVRDNNGSRVSVDLIGAGVPVMQAQGDAMAAAAAAQVQFTVSGTYRKGANVVAGECRAVTRNGKQVGAILARAPIAVPNNMGNWTATLTLNANDAPGQGQKLTVVAVLTDGGGAVVAQFGRKGPKRP